MLVAYFGVTAEYTTAPTIDIERYFVSMSNKSFSKRSKSKSFRPAGGMKRDLVKRDNADSGRESMVGSHIIDEPVFEESRHEKAIDKAEDEAYSESPKPKTEIPQGSRNNLPPTGPVRSPLAHAAVITTGPLSNLTAKDHATQQ